MTVYLKLVSCFFTNITNNNNLVYIFKQGNSYKENYFLNVYEDIL